MRFFSALLLACLLFACSSGHDSAVAKAEKSIAQFEDSLRKQPSASHLPKLKLIEKYIEFQQQFPTAEKAPEFLDKAHMVYAGIGLYAKSAQVADQLLNTYPKYVNRAMVLESQASNYDVFITPRDSSKVRFYYNQLLKEFPDMDKTKKEDIVSRLKFNHLNIEELVMQQVEKQ